MGVREIHEQGELEKEDVWRGGREQLWGTTHNKHKQISKHNTLSAADRRESAIFLRLGALPV